MSDEEQITLNKLRQLQVELIDDALMLSKETNADKLVAGAKALQRRAQQLEIKAQMFEAQERLKYPPPPRGKIQIQLTWDQRYRIFAETGIDLPVLQLEDVGLSWNEMMPHMLPQQVEGMAMRRARQLQQQKQAQIEADAQVASALRKIEESDSEEARKMLAELKKDPKFLGGMLQKKGT